MWSLIVCYDIADRKRLVKVAKLMEDHGERLQKSVFLCYLHPRRVARLRVEVAELIDDEEDCVAFIRLCERCERAIEWMGREPDVTVDAMATVISAQGDFTVKI